MHIKRELAHHVDGDGEYITTAYESCGTENFSTEERAAIMNEFKARGGEYFVENGLLHISFKKI